MTCRRNCLQIRPDEPTAPETEVCVTMLPSAQRERWGIKSCCLDNSFAKVPSNFVDFCGAHFSFPAMKQFRSTAEMAHRFHPELTSCQAFFQSQTSRQLTPVLLEKILLECHRVVKNMIWYSFERPFSIAAIEVGTWEIFFNWEVFNDQV